MCCVHRRFDLPASSRCSWDSRGMRQVGWRNSAVGVSKHCVPGDPMGLEITSARAQFYR